MSQWNCQLICSPLTDSDKTTRLIEEINKKRREEMAWRPRNLHDTFIPICWLNRFLCLAVFERHGKPVWKISLIYNIICHTFYFIALSYGIPLFEKHFGGFERVVFYLILFVNILVAVASVVTGWFNSKFLHELKDRVTKVDVTLMKLGMSSPYRKEFRRIVISLTVWWALLLLVTWAVYAWTLEQFSTVFSIILTVLMHIPNAQNFVVDLSFNVCVRCVRWRMILLNDLINKTIHCQTRRYDHSEAGVFGRFQQVTVATMSSNARKRYIMHFLSTIKQSHLEIVRLARLVNRTYSNLILMELAVNFTLITGCLYNFYFALLEMDLIHLRVSYRLVATGMWASVIGLKVGMINRECDAVQREERVLGETLREFNWLQVDDDDIRDEIQQFCMQVILHPIFFCASGFVRLDNYCTRMFFGTVTTYLVILIQMSSTPAAMRTIMREDRRGLF